MTENTNVNKLQNKEAHIDINMQEIAKDREYKMNYDNVMGPIRRTN